MTPHKEELIYPPKKYSLNSDTNQHSIDDQDDSSLDKSARPLRKTNSITALSDGKITRAPSIKDKVRDFLKYHKKFNPNLLILMVLPSLIFVIGSLFSHFQYQSTPDSKVFGPELLPYKQEILVNNQPFFGDLTTD